MTSFSIQSFGCRVNQAEAFCWVDEFQRKGLRYEKDFSKSDLVIVNTCTLTSRADRDVRSFIRRVSRLNPEAKLIVTGCFVERAPEELKVLPKAWQVYSNQEKGELPEGILSHADTNKGGIIKPYRSRPLVKIQDGCDFECTFCIIPSVRGGSISYSQERILELVKGYINRGFREIILTGIHLCLYGRDMQPKSSLLNLLEAVSEIKGLARIRLSSLDPRFMDSALLECLVSNHKIAPHFHLSLQHGADNIISQMGRKITVADYSTILEFLHSGSPSAALGADIIVGFPGETEEDFRDMYSFLEKSLLTYLHVFSFSPRPGTPASGWPKVNTKVKKKRSELLRELSKEKRALFLQRFLGEKLEAVVIKKAKNGARVLTENYIEVFIPDCSAEAGGIVQVRIYEISGDKVFGKVVDV
jgi:threonylcarbamoyladenosine tRNA methylthiotransferase MtaB